ncbi:MAG TPA: glycosyltransferase family 4 protein [Gemmataceae bacterium]|nr:glycosyltransferase family 4 protein [Gemmataceae bacterium]
MRIAHFIQRYPPALGGSEAYFARLSRYLAAAGERVTVFTTTALDLEAFWSPRGRCLSAGMSVEDGVEVRRYPLVGRFRGRRWLLKPLSLLPHRLWQCLTLPCNPVAWAMWQDAGRNLTPFDLVHAAAFPYAWPIACARRLAHRLRVPFVLTPFLHLGDPDNPRDRTRRAYTTPPFRYLVCSADLIFVQTERERAALRELGVAAERLVLQGMGVDRGECTGGDRSRARQQWGVGAEEVVVGHLANLSAEKGSIDLLRAAERAWQDGHRFRLVLAGPEMPSFRRFWDSYPFAERVRRLGVLTEEAKRDFFAGLDLFALPSRSDSFGLVLLEAWANGAANVAYRAGGPAEIIRHEKDGLLVPCGDVDGLALALVRLVADDSLRRRLGAAGRERAQREFRWEDKLAMVRTAYQELVERFVDSSVSRSGMKA